MHSSYHFLRNRLQHGIYHLGLGIRSFKQECDKLLQVERKGDGELTNHTQQLPNLVAFQLHGGLKKTFH